MKALSFLRSAIHQGSLVAMTALVAITPWIYPEVVVAATNSQNEGQSALIFEIKDPGVLQPQKPTNINIDQIIEQDPLVGALEDYLDKHGSPLKEYAPELVKLPQWQRALAISWVESNFGIHCPYLSNNCSGIGVAPGHPSWRTYPTKLDWFKDLTNLLEKPIYKEKYSTCKKMRGIYVYPGSNNWVWGCEKKLEELMQLTEQSRQEQMALFNTPITMAVSITGTQNQ